MYTKQVSVFLENKKGRLADVTKLLTEAGINIRALSLADTADYGVLRLIVDDRPKCLDALRAHGLAAQETEVLAVEIEDKPGGLNRVVSILDCEGLNIEYMYAFVEKNGDNAIVFFKIDDVARAAETLRKSGIPVLPEDMIQNL